MKVNTLLQSPVRVVNIGLRRFAEDLKKRDVRVVHVEWSPPARGDPKLRALLSKMGS
jgi:FdrA protein